MINAAMTSEKTERSARPEQDQLILECIAIIRPLGWENDGKMGKKRQEVWEPLARLVNQGLGPTNWLLYLPRPRLMQLILANAEKE
jgi:hypothetical protein